MCDANFIKTQDNAPPNNSEGNAYPPSNSAGNACPPISNDSDDSSDDSGPLGGPLQRTYPGFIFPVGTVVDPETGKTHHHGVVDFYANITRLTESGYRHYLILWLRLSAAERDSFESPQEWYEKTELEDSDKLCNDICNDMKARGTWEKFVKRVYPNGPPSSQNPH